MNRRSTSRRARKLSAIALTVALTITGAVVGAQAASAASPAVAADVVAPAPTAAKKVMVTTADLNLRKSPSTSGKIITTLAKGTKVTVTASSGSWRKVSVGKRVGWVSAKFLKAVVVKKAARVTVTSRTKSSVDLGTKLTFSGTTSKNLTGKTVALQIKAGGSWSTIKKAKVSSKHKFSLAVKATQAGAQSYRLYAASTKTTKAAASKAYTYTVWSWYTIVGKDVDASNTWADDALIGGVTFGQSLLAQPGVWSGDAWADYNVSYKCTKFRATIGMDDSARTGAVRSFSLGIDSTTQEFGSRGIGAGLLVSADITDANRIRLNVKMNGNEVDGLGAFGTPQVYCSTAP